MSWLSEMFLNTEGSDLVVTFGDEGCQQKQFPAHSSVFTNRSKVFRTMLDADKFREGKSGQVHFKTVPENVGVEFLRFLYQDQISDCSISSLVLLISAGCMYDIPDLVSTCDLQLQPKINLSNSCQIYQDLYLLRSDTNKPKESLAKSMSLMCTAAEIVISLDMHLLLDESALVSFLTNDLLNVQNELPVFHALWRWGKRQCLQQSITQTDDNVHSSIRHLLHCVRHRIYLPANQSLLDYVSRTKIEFSSAGKRRKAVVNPSSLLQFGVAVKCGEKPIVPSRKLNPHSVPRNTTKRALENMFQVSSDRKCFLLGFEVSVYVEGIAVQPNDSRASDWLFMVNGNTNGFHATSSDVVKIPSGVVFKVVAELAMPVELVPGKFCTVKYCGQRPIYFSSNNFLTVQAKHNTTSFTIRSLKNLALSLLIYTT